MNRARFSFLVSIALVVTVFVPWLSTHAQPQANPQPQANSKVQFIHTDDWQSGDEVSFTIRGVVVDNNPPEDNKQPNQGQSAQQSTQSQSGAGANLQGYVVEMEDPKGNKTQIPWTPLIQYSVPNVEGPITATVIGPGGAQVGTTQIPVYKAGTSIPVQVTTQSSGTSQVPTQSSGTLVAPPISQMGQTYQIYSPSGALNGQGDATLIVGGSSSSSSTTSEIKALAESPRSAVFEPTELKPGPTTFTVKEGPALEASFTVSVIGIGLDTRRLQTRGQVGTLVLQVTGFPTDPDALHKLMASNPVVNLVNQTPSILAFTQSPPHITWTVHESEVEGGMWTQNIPTVAQQRGQFQMTATVTTSALINSSVSVVQSEQPSSPPGTPTAMRNSQFVSAQQTSSEFQTSAAANTSASKNLSSSPGVAQSDPPSSLAGSSAEHSASTDMGEEHFISTDPTSSQGEQKDPRYGFGPGCPYPKAWMKGTLSLKKNGDVNDIYLKDESGIEVMLPNTLPALQAQVKAFQAQVDAIQAQAKAIQNQAAQAKTPLAKQILARQAVANQNAAKQAAAQLTVAQAAAAQQTALQAAADKGETWYVCFDVKNKVDLKKNAGPTAQPGFIAGLDDPKVSGNLRFVFGKVTKEKNNDKPDRYWIVDERTGIKYEITIGNGCDRVWEKKYTEWQLKKDAFKAYDDYVKGGRKPPPVAPARDPGPPPPEIELNAVQVIGTIDTGRDEKTPTPTIGCTKRAEPANPAK